MKRFTLTELETLPTLHTGHFDNLKIDQQSPRVRVWLSRLTVADGAPYNHQVTVEEYKNNNWRTIDQYCPKSNKYKYLLVIQQCGNGWRWEDVSEYETDSHYRLDRETRKLYHHDLQEYIFSRTGNVRTIRRRELINKGA